MKVTEPGALRAMAHPLRLDLIELLGTVGPLTAAECARRLGSTQASCSYHLRQLARYGFVERDERDEPDERVDRRERPWRVVDVEQSWSEDGPAARQLERVFVQREADRVLAWEESRAEQPEPWRDLAFLGGATLPLTADEVVDLRDRLSAVIEPYVARLTTRTGWPSGYRFVRVLLAATPAGADPDTPAGADPEETI